MDPVSLLKSKTAAVVTTFAPDDNLEDNLRCISTQAPLVILVDDTGLSPTRSIPTIGNLVVIRHPRNLGIGAALNSGIEEAARQGYEWVITLDDDTRVRHDYLDKAFAFVQRSAVPKLGLVALSRPGSSTLKEALDADGHTSRRNIITSGSVFPIALFRALGGFSAELFIDLVDFDFCCRARQAGWALEQLNAIGMEHRVGNSEKRRCLGFSVTIYNHAPFRLYYQARNTIVFARRHFGFDPMLCSYLLVELIRLPAKAICFERDKLNRLRHITAGVRDALLGRLGRMP